MNKIALHIILLLGIFQISYSQVEDGVVALDIPVRNSLTFNRYIVNPTFSFVREQNKYITATNKRELVGVDNAPNTYLFGYSGRFRENIGTGVGVFQQNYGVLTTFGGIVNFAYNVRIQEDSNATFGLNVGAYKSGLNSGKVITNFDDPALDNIPSNFLITVNPGFNYGTGFMDFGISYNNLVLYNFNTSAMVKENPISGIQGHIMYTGYFGGYGFFGDSRMSLLGRTEFQKDATVISGQAMITIPKGIWAQVSYNSKYGFSGGLGVNLTPQFAIEYNYEKSLGGLSDFGASHEITLAYRFKNDNYYDYSRDDEIAGLLNFDNNQKKKKVAKTPPAETKVNSEEQSRLAAEEQARQEAEEQSRIAAEEQARQEAEEQSRIAAEEQARQEAEEQARIAAEEQARQEAEEQSRIAAEEQARQEAEEQSRIAAEEQARQEAEEQARIAAEEQARQEAEEQARIAAEEQARQEAEEQARIAAEEQARQEAEKNKNELLVNPTDRIGKSISKLTSETDQSNVLQTKLLSDLAAAVAIKEQDLKDLKEENDLSEQNIYVEPKPFKSISKENEAIELIKINLDEIILKQNKKIKQLESLLEERMVSFPDLNDETNLYYKNRIEELKAEQEKAIREKAKLVSSLKEISIATEFERKRRIKRAAYDNDQDRYSKDRNTLKSLKQTVSLRTTPLELKDIDFGRERNGNIQIVKNVEHAENGYYLVLAVHNNIKKRDEFLSQVISTGNKEVDFFFDVKTNEYYIYSRKFTNINETERALKSKSNEPYNEKITIVKIEN